MTTSIAELARPPKSFWASVLTATDWEPSACQPAPLNAFSTLGAKKPRTITMRSQLRKTLRLFLTDQAPSRPSGPGVDSRWSIGRSLDVVSTGLRVDIRIVYIPLGVYRHFWLVTLIPHGVY